MPNIIDIIELRDSLGQQATELFNLAHPRDMTRCSVQQSARQEARAERKFFKLWNKIIKQQDDLTISNRREQYILEIFQGDTDSKISLLKQIAIGMAFDNGLERDVRQKILQSNDLRQILDCIDIDKEKLPEDKQEIKAEEIKAQIEEKSPEDKQEIKAEEIKAQIEEKSPEDKQEIKAQDKQKIKAQDKQKIKAQEIKAQIEEISGKIDSFASDAQRYRQSSTSETEERPSNYCSCCNFDPMAMLNTFLWHF